MFASAHLLHYMEDVVVDVLLGVNGEGVACGVVVVFEEQVLEGHGVLLLKGDHHLVTEAKQHQLWQRGERNRRWSEHAGAETNI